MVRLNYVDGIVVTVSSLGFFGGRDRNKQSKNTNIQKKSKKRRMLAGQRVNFLFSL